MRMIKHGFPPVLLDNETTYFSHLEGVVDSVDELASVEVFRGPVSYSFRISTSTPMYSQPLLKSLLDFHTLLGIQLDLGKSIKNSSTISFVIYM